MAKRLIFSDSQLVKTDMPQSVKSVLGTKYRNIEVIRYAGRHTCNNGSHQYYMLCKCICGKEIYCPASKIKRDEYKSCGCLKRTNPGRLKHGYAVDKGKLYYTWKGMRTRCYNKKSVAYSRYGGAGIVVCSGWKGDDGFINFKNDIGEPPSKEYSLDRINFRGNYSCGHCQECIKNGWESNCRWADKYTQSRNRSSNKYVSINGKKLTYAEANRELGFTRGSIEGRISLGWTLETAISKPITKGKVSYTKDVQFYFKENQCKSDIDMFLSLWQKLKPTISYSYTPVLKHLNLI